MNKWAVASVALIALMLLSTPGWCQEAASPGTEQPVARTGAGAAENTEDAAPHPALPDRSDRWPGTVVIIILSMFLAALLVGPIVRANMPEEVPPTHTHDEPPGASHHHGKSGTLNPEPGHGHADHHHSDHGASVHGAADQGATDPGATDHGSADHGAAGHGHAGGHH